MGTFNTASFPLGKVIKAGDASIAEYSKQLGHEIEREKGKRYRLVEAASNDGTTGRKKVYKFVSEALYTVDICGDGQTPCGVQLPDQESLADGDLFWLQVAGLATCVDSGSGVTKDDVVDAAAAGDVATLADVSEVAETVVGRVTATASADADAVVRLRGGL